MKTIKNMETTTSNDLQYLQAKKNRDGQLSKLGEWMLSGEPTGWTYDAKDIRYILR